MTRVLGLVKAGRRLEQAGKSRIAVGEFGFAETVLKLNQAG